MTHYPKIFNPLYLRIHSYIYKKTMPRYFHPKLCLLIAVIFFSRSVPAQEKNAKDSIYSVIYFGATDCYYCNIEKNISNISKMVTEIKDNYEQLNIKTTIVSMNKDIAEG